MTRPSAPHRARSGSRRIPDIASSYDSLTTPTLFPLLRALLDVREILERARRTGDRREIEAAIERINAELDERG